MNIRHLVLTCLLATVVVAAATALATKESEKMM